MGAPRLQSGGGRHEFAARVAKVPRARRDLRRRRAVRGRTGRAAAGGGPRARGQRPGRGRGPVATGEVLGHLAEACVSAQLLDRADAQPEGPRGGRGLRGLPGGRLRRAGRRRRWQLYRRGEGDRGACHPGEPGKRSRPRGLRGRRQGDRAAAADRDGADHRGLRAPTSRSSAW